MCCVCIFSCIPFDGDSEMLELHEIKCIVHIEYIYLICICIYYYIETLTQNVEHDRSANKLQNYISKLSHSRDRRER